MLHNILIVDDNQPFLNLIKKIFEKFSNKYNVVTTNSGIKAIELLSFNYFSIVLTDLQMPNMDGFTLLEKIKKNFPDIPVIVITAFDKPKTNLVVKKTGAYAYFTKPLVIDDLIICIENLIKKETEGGILNNASIEMFIQLLEMESKTCTIRIINEKSKEHGVLFFRDGELYNARILKTVGKEAAYRILSWDKVNISIENNCIIDTKEINEDLQAILLDALRLKDELGSLEKDFNEFSVKPNESIEPITKVEVKKTDNDASLIDSIKNISDAENSIKSVKINKEWNSFNSQATVLGFYFNSGVYKGSYLNNYSSDNLIIIPIDDDKSYEIVVDLKCSPERIINSINN
ncbi:MAG: response regulator [Desulfobacteraceae bacterium]|jgi:CheY-like chemotaxis protein